MSFGPGSICSCLNYKKELRHRGSLFMIFSDSRSRPTNGFKRRRRGFALGSFLTFAFPASQLLALMNDRAFKDTVVIGTSHVSQFVARRFAGRFLKNFLQLAFWIVQIRDPVDFTESVLETAKNEIASGLESAI